SDLSSAAPRDLSGARAAAFCELGQPCVSPPAWRDRADLRAAASSMLEKDPTDALAAWLLARAAMGDDRALSRAAVDRSLLLSASGAPSLALRAQQLLHDPEVPDRIGRARALAHLVEAAGRSPTSGRMPKVWSAAPTASPPRPRRRVAAAIWRAPRSCSRPPPRSGPLSPRASNSSPICSLRARRLAWR